LKKGLVRVRGDEPSIWYFHNTLHCGYKRRLLLA